MDNKRDNQMLNQRFPELDKATKEFNGESDTTLTLANKKIHADEIKNFSQVVYDLANETEPHPSRINYMHRMAAEKRLNKTLK